MQSSAILAVTVSLATAPWLTAAETWTPLLAPGHPAVPSEASFAVSAAVDSTPAGTVRGKKAPLLLAMDAQRARMAADGRPAIPQGKRRYIVTLGDAVVQDD